MKLDKLVFCIETIIFIVYAETFLTSRFKYNILSKLPVIAILIYVQIIFNLENGWQRLYISFLLDCTILSICYKDKKSKKLFVTTTYYSISISAQSGIVLLLSSKFGFAAKEFVMDGVKSLGVFTLNSCVMIIIIAIIFHIKNKKWIVLEARVLVMLSVLPFLSILAIWHIFPFTYNSINYDTVPKLYYLCFLLLAFNLIVFVAYELLQKLFLEKEEKKSIHTLMQAQTDFFNERLKLTEQTKNIVHDHIKTIRVLKYLFKQAPDKASDYLDEILNDTNNLSYARYTGNDIVDAVIWSFDYQLVETRIEIKCSSILPPTLFISDVDIMLLLGNALENAVKATLVWANQPNVINIDFLYSADMIEITVQNPSNKPQSKLLIKTPNDIKTSGRGLKIMAGVAQKYDGTIMIRSNNNIFRLEIILYNRV